MAPRKAGTPVLGREDIVAVAMTIVDRDGLERLSMRRLAAELGRSPMSLYYHVPDKSKLYDLILDAVMSEVDTEAEGGEQSLADRLITFARNLYAVLMEHPHAVPLALSRSFSTEAQLRPVEVMLGILMENGRSPSDAMGIVNVVGQFVFGTAAARANHVTENELHDASREGDVSVVTPDEFPNLDRVIREASGGGFEADFERGLRALVQGLLI